VKANRTKSYSRRIMSLGENIFKQRTNQNWSQTDLANELNVSRQSVSKWENNTAVPDLDKLIKMSRLFNISLDALVFDTPPQNGVETPRSNAPFSSVQSTIGIIMMIFGMTLFLLSIFWGDHLYFGEAFGELFSIIIVLSSTVMLAPYNFNIMGICAIIYFLYTVVCYGILNVSSLYHYIFTFIAGALIVIWFITYGIHETAKNN